MARGGGGLVSPPIILRRTPRCVIDLKHKSSDCRQTQLRYFIQENDNMLRSKRPSSGQHYKNSGDKVQCSKN